MQTEARAEEVVSEGREKCTYRKDLARRKRVAGRCLKKRGGGVENWLNVFA